MVRARVRRPLAAEGTRLRAFVRSGGPLRRLAVERFDGEPVMGSAVEELLVERGFRPGLRKLVLSA